jgi:hypothetical protein
MKTGNSIARFAALFIMGGLSFGCATPFEHQLGTTPQYHALLKIPIMPSAVDPTLLDAPHYIIGVEKAHIQSVERLLPCLSGSHASRYCLNLDAFSVTNPWRTKIARQNDTGKTLFVSHIARLDPVGANTGSRRVCFLYNVYPHSEFPEAATCSTANPAQTTDPVLSVAGGLDALVELGQELDERILNEPAERQPTHLIVMSTGWNTLQVESLDNYQHWISHLMQAARNDARRPFRPLVIGLTWPSEWPLVSTWLGPVVSVLNKENDADELGYVTANVLLHKILSQLKAKHGLPVIVIGHSFGGRAMVTAANSRALLFQDASASPTTDLLLGLQPAFSIQRFGGGSQGDPYVHFAQGAHKYVLSSSTNDWILKFAGLTNPVGGSRGLAKATALPERFEIVPLTAAGQWSMPPSRNECHMVMLDASAAINGHHDVYSASIGRLMWQAIQSFAPASSWPAISSPSVPNCQPALN